MIRANDALLLARTKLKLRIVRLSMTIFISSLLFAALIFGGLVATGAINSAKSFSVEGFGNRYIVTARPLTYNTPFSSGSNDLIKQLEPIQAKLLADKKAAAKKLNITYDQQSDLTLPINENKLANGATEKYVNIQSEYVKNLINKLNNDKTVLSYDSFKKLAVSGGSVETYRSTGASFYNFPSSTNPTFKVLDPTKPEKPIDLQTSMSGMPKGLDSITSYGWSRFDDSLLKPFVLSGQNLDLGSDGSIPLIAPMSAAEEMLGLKAPSSTASTAEKLQHIKDVRSGIGGKTAKLCYRNSLSAELFQKAVDQQTEIESNKNNKDYIKPNLIYQAPTEPCGPTTVKTDTRSDEEKRQAANEKEFKKQFGEVVEQDQSIVNVRIVGITSEPDFNPSFSAESIMRTILQSSLGTGWFSPNEAMSKSDAVKKAVGTGDFNSMPLESMTYFAEFKTLSAAKKFIKDYSCENQNNFSTPPAGFEPCVDSGKPYYISPYGNNAGAIEEFRHGFWNVAKYVTLVVVIFATLIMMGNVGKIIADSRRETAVFRALGAKRFDISQIYITYSLLLAVLLFITAAFIGVIGAFWLDSWLSPVASLSAVLAYNSSDVEKQFHLFSFDFRILLGVFVLIVISAVLSTVGPLSGNLSRNPIKDMRDEG